MIEADHFLPLQKPVSILMTSGASCPDAVVEQVIRKLLTVAGMEEKYEATTAAFTAQ